MTVGRARARGGLAAAGILAVAVICLAGALQLRPIPAAELNHLVTEVADPASVQHCTTASQVRYCLYPGFGRDLPSLEAPVNGVLAHLPARPAQPLTVRQVVALDFPDPTLTHGHPQRQVSQWDAGCSGRRARTAPASAIYLPVGSWPRRRAAGRRAFRPGPGHRRLGGPHPAASHRQPERPGVPAMRAARPGAGGDRDLAGHPRHPPPGQRAPGWPGRLGARHAGGGRSATPSSRPGPIPARAPATSRRPGRPQTTAAGYLLADAMTSLPEQKVSQVLTERMGYLAELAHHRRPARRRARHPHAQRPGPPAAPPDPQTRDDGRAAGPGGGLQSPAVHSVNPPGAGAAPRASGQPVRHARRSRPSWLRALPLLARPITADDAVGHAAHRLPGRHRFPRRPGPRRRHLPLAARPGHRPPRLPARHRGAGLRAPRPVPAADPGHPGPGLGGPGRPPPAGRPRPGRDLLGATAHHGPHHPAARPRPPCPPSTR